jgi:hypothetical protein
MLTRAKQKAEAGDAEGERIILLSIKEIAAQVAKGHCHAAWQVAVRLPAR